MKILAIRIKNLASLEGITEIDFTKEPLATAGIFAITGPTGAGKSTLLDALCLALYGKTPRYLQAKENNIDIQDVVGSTKSQGDVRGILRDGTADGYAEVDFLGTDKHHYRATWTVRRARNKAEGSLQADTIALLNTSTNVNLPGKKTEVYKEIERLVGLNFEQFTRSVLLAQGDFTAFMKANKDEKSSLLEKLTGTSIYSEISKKIFEKYKTEEQTYRELNIRREGIATLTEEELKNLEAEEQVLAQELQQLSQELTSLSTEIKWNEQLTLLQTNKNLAEINLQKVTENLLQSEGRKHKLFQVEQAQTTRTWNDALLYNQTQLAEKQALLQLCNTKITDLQSQRALLDLELKKNETAVKQLTDLHKKTLPELAQAKKLDTLLSEKEKQKELAQSEVALTQNKLEIQQKKIAEKKREQEQFLSEITSIEEWQTKFQSKKAIAENKEVIISKLTDALSLLTLEKKSTSEKESLDTKIIALSVNIETQTGLLNNLTHDFEIQKKTVKKQAEEVLLFPIEKLHIDKNEADRIVQLTLEAQSVWQVLDNLNIDCSNLFEKQTNNGAILLQKNESFLALKTQLEKDFITKETSGKLLEKARLSATETIEDLRKTLVDNEPCPVCGSENHPYALHNPQLEKVLSELEKTHQENEKIYLHAFGLNSRLTQEIQNLSELITQQETELTTKKNIIKDKSGEWNALTIAVECEEVADAEKLKWLNQKIKTWRFKQAALQVQINEHTELKNQLDREKSQLEELKEKKDQVEFLLQDLRSQLAVFNEKKESSEKQILQTQQALKAIKDELSVYFTTLDWMENWRSEPTEFSTRILNFAHEWKENAAKLEEVKKQYLLVSEGLHQLENQLKSIAEELLQKTNFYTTLEADFDQLKSLRNALFEGKPTEFIEEQMVLKTEKAQNELEVSKTTLNTNKIEAATTETQQKEIEKTIVKFAFEIQQLTIKIQEWLDNYNQNHSESLTYVEVKELLQFSREWIKNEQKIVNRIEKEKTEATSILLERTQILEAHIAIQTSRKSLEELKILFENGNLQSEQLTLKKANISFKLKEDQINKNKIGDLLTEISKQFKVYENWGKLNEMIGSADGKKFRQIAQEYTLETLLSFANQHLKNLTPRYRIERIPNTLGLQVIDLDMGDEIRTVYSLSGGESFLVSLALALGLASLTSSKMKVESLFIDEGFGSLDPNTLNIAMDALERLHNQGRKVGVISHVQEMTERIPVQIKVSKKANGKSIVEVIG